MLSKKYEVTESGYGQVEKIKKWTVRVNFMHGDADTYTSDDYGFDKRADALEWYALWAGLAKLPTCYDGVVAYANWILKNIDREKALFFFYSPEQQGLYLAENFVKEYFLADADAFSDKFEKRQEEIEDILMYYYPTDNQGYGDKFAKCDTVKLLCFDAEKRERREMRVGYA